MIKLNLKDLKLIARRKADGCVFEPIFRYDPIAAEKSGRKVYIAEKEGARYFQNDELELFASFPGEDNPGHIGYSPTPPKVRQCQVFLNTERSAFPSTELLVCAEDCVFSEHDVRFYDAQRNLMAVFPRDVFVTALWEGS